MTDFQIRVNFLKEFIPEMRHYWKNCTSLSRPFLVWFVETFPEISPDELWFAGF
jgi:hypothetical protein